MRDETLSCRLSRVRPSYHVYRCPYTLDVYWAVSNVPPMPHDQMAFVWEGIP